MYVLIFLFFSSQKQINTSFAISTFQYPAMVSTIQAIQQALDEEMERDENVFIIGEEVGLSGGHKHATSGLIHKYGYHRVVDAPISEIGFTGLAVGASYLGLRPVVDFMCWSFSLQAIDHIINSAAKTCFMSASRLHCPIVFRGPSGFEPGYAAQHTHEFFTIYGTVPGLKVVAPYTPQEHKSLLKAAIRDENPVVFLENAVLYSQVCSDLDDSVMDLGTARILRQGEKVTIIGVSLGLQTVENAVQKYISTDSHRLEEIEIINLISLNPIDYTTILESVEKTRRLIIVDFSWPNYSVAHEISAVVYDKLYGKLAEKIICLTGKETHVGYATSLEDAFYPTEEEVVLAISSLMCNKNTD